MPKPETASRWRVGDGEEARQTPGATAEAEVWSRGYLPLRVRSEASYRLRPAFPGTAVVLGLRTYEVLTETELPEEGLVVYRLRLWPEGEVVRDRVVYGSSLVQAAQAEREAAQKRERARPFRFLLYPLVGLLPEADQVRLSERFGLYAVTATLVSGLVEAAIVLLLGASLARAGSRISASVLPLAASLGVFVVPALGRSFGALFLRETAGSAPVVALVAALRSLGVHFERHDRTLLPLTREAFWERLSRPDTVTSEPDGSLVYRGLLPHLTWDGGHRLESGGDYWRVVPEPPVVDRGRLVHAYRLFAMDDPQATRARPPQPLPDSAYVDEVLAGVQREWDEWNFGFAWLTSLLGEELQARAFDHRGGPTAARGATLWTAAATAASVVYVLTFLPGSPPADPMGPLLGLGALLLLVDAVRRWRAAGTGRYAPSLLRFAIPSGVLRPERIAYIAHRDAEREILREFYPSR